MMFTAFNSIQKCCCEYIDDANYDEYDLHAKEFRGLEGARSGWFERLTRIVFLEAVLLQLVCTMVNILTDTNSIAMYLKRCVTRPPFQGLVKQQDSLDIVGYGYQKRHSVSSTKMR
jgi:hypothetical protein